MTTTIFNASLLIGLLLIIGGVAGLHSIAAAALAGGVTLVVLTLLLARWAGVAAPHAKGKHVPE